MARLEIVLGLRSTRASGAATDGPWRAATFVVELVAADAGDGCGCWVGVAGLKVGCLFFQGRTH